MLPSATVQAFGEAILSTSDLCNRHLAHVSPQQRQSNSTDKTLPTMAIVIILVYGESRHLIPKPADYATLIDVVRAKFHELGGVATDNIAFHFTPEWFDAEVELDRGAFSEVHARAVLRITATVSAPVQHPSHKVEAQDADVPAKSLGNSPSAQDSGTSALSGPGRIPITVHYGRRKIGS